MIYYFYPGDIPKADLYEYLINDEAQLGESSFNNFWVGGGFHKFKSMVESNSNFDDMIIMNERGEELSPDEFLSQISKLKIIGA